MAKLQREKDGYYVANFVFRALMGYFFQWFSYWGRSFEFASDDNSWKEYSGNQCWNKNVFIPDWTEAIGADDINVIAFAG